MSKKVQEVDMDLVKIVARMWLQVVIEEMEENGEVKS
jgi:hypothetical protein